MTAMPQVSSVVAIEALGVAIDISISGSQADEAVSLIGAAWSGAARLGGVAERSITVCAGEPDQSADLSSPDLEFLLHHLSQLVTRVAIEARAGDLMMLHAAGLAHPVTGATVALVAPSGTGKTTICRSLGKMWGYVSDETVGFDSALAVFPYRKPLSIVRGTDPVKRQCSPHEVDLAAPPARLILSAVIMLVRDAGLSAVEVEQVRTVAALPLLAEQTSYLARHRRPLQLLAGALEETGGLRLVRYRSSDNLAPLITELIGAPQ